jgi:hypothetical protein
MALYVLYSILDTPYSLSSAVYYQLSVVCSLLSAVCSPAPFFCLSDVLSLLSCVRLLCISGLGHDSISIRDESTSPLTPFPNLAYPFYPKGGDTQCHFRTF